MPYAPAVAPWSASPSDYTAGQSRAQAITNVGNSIAQGMNQWFQNDKQDTQTRAQVAALLPQFADRLTNPEDKTLLEKFINHKSNYKDNGYLLGVFATLKASDEDRAKQQYMQAQTALLQQQQRAQERQLAMQQTADANLKFAEDVGKNPFIYNNQSVARAKAITGDPLYSVANSARTFGLDPALVERFSTSRYTPGASVLEPFTMTTTDAKGNPVHTTINKRTGQIIGQGPVIPQAGTPQMQAETASLVEQAKKEADSANTFLTDVTDSAENARVRASAIKRINALYDAGAQSGFAQGQLTDIQAALSRVGLGKKGLSNQQQLNKELNTLVMETGRDLMKGGGSVSNYERSLIADSTANPSLDPAANRNILKVLGAIADRAVILDRERQKLDDQGLPQVEIAKRLRKLRDSIPVGIEELGSVKLPAGWEVIKPKS